MRARYFFAALAYIGLQLNCGPGSDPRAAAAVEDGSEAQPAAGKSLAVAQDVPRGGPQWQAQLLDEDAHWLDRLARVREGTDVRASALPGELKTPSFKNVGMLPLDGDGYRRVASLDLAVPQLVPTHLQELSEIDCIAIISINFKPERPLYIFATLRSLFSAFPAGIEVNILVGDENGDYLRPERLRLEIGEELAARVHVWAASQADGHYLREHLSLHERGGWNYARALRSYRGSKNFLLMEDDVTWSRGAGGALNLRLLTEPRELVSLYNRPGAEPAQSDVSAEPTPPAEGHLRWVDVTDRQHFFYGTQGIVFSAQTARGIGNFLQLRLHEAPYDLHMNTFFTLHHLFISYAHPSIVQHVGFSGTGYGTHFHASPCFAEEVH